MTTPDGARDSAEGLFLIRSPARVDGVGRVLRLSNGTVTRVGDSRGLSSNVVGGSSVTGASGILSSSFSSLPSTAPPLGLSSAPPEVLLRKRDVCLTPGGAWTTGAIWLAHTYRVMTGDSSRSRMLWLSTVNQPDRGLTVKAP